NQYIELLHNSYIDMAVIKILPPDELLKWTIRRISRSPEWRFAHSQPEGTRAARRSEPLLRCDPASAVHVSGRSSENCRPAQPKASRASHRRSRVQLHSRFASSLERQDRWTPDVHRSSDGLRLFGGRRLRNWWLGRSAEIYLGHLPRSLGGFEVRIVGLETCPAGKYARGELLDVGVVVLQGVVVALPCHGDAIFSAGQLVLQAQKVFVRLQLRIVLPDHDKATKGAVQLI